MKSDPGSAGFCGFLHVVSPRGVFSPPSFNMLKSEVSDVESIYQKREDLTTKGGKIRASTYTLRMDTLHKYLHFFAGI